MSLAQINIPLESVNNVDRLTYFSITVFFGHTILVLMPFAIRCMVPGTFFINTSGGSLVSRVARVSLGVGLVLLVTWRRVI